MAQYDPQRSNNRHRKADDEGLAPVDAMLGPDPDAPATAPTVPAAAGGRAEDDRGLSDPPLAGPVKKAPTKKSVKAPTKKSVKKPVKKSVKKAVKKAPVKKASAKKTAAMKAPAGKVPTKRSNVESSTASAPVATDASVAAARSVEPDTPAGSSTAPDVVGTVPPASAWSEPRPGPRPRRGGATPVVVAAAVVAALTVIWLLLRRRRPDED